MSRRSLWTQQALDRAAEAERLLEEAGRPIAYIVPPPTEVEEESLDPIVRAAGAYATLALVYATLAAGEPR